MRKEILTAIRYKEDNLLFCVYYADQTFAEVFLEDYHVYPKIGEWKFENDVAWWRVDEDWNIDKYGDEILQAVVERELLSE